MDECKNPECEVRIIQADRQLSGAIVKAIGTGFSCLLLTMLGGCWISHHYTLHQLKEVRARLEVRKTVPVFGPEFDVDVKPEAK